MGPAWVVCVAASEPGSLALFPPERPPPPPPATVASLQGRAMRLVAVLEPAFEGPVEVVDDPLPAIASGPPGLVA
jgi:hypothetical protein